MDPTETEPRDLPSGWAFDGELRSRLTARLDAFPRRSLEVGDDLRKAAVAITLVADDEGSCAFLLTLRSSKLRRHRGQFALPGGRVDPGETPTDAARRELAEELGVALGPERVLGRLDDYRTKSGYRITPFVLWGDRATEVRPDPREVAEAFVVPLEELARAVPASGRPTGPVPSLRLVGTRVFAPTAALLVQFVEVVLRGRSTRIDDFPEPFFARS